LVTIQQTHTIRWRPKFFDYPKGKMTPPLSTAIQCGYVRWWLKLFGRRKGGNANNIIFEKKSSSTLNFQLSQGWQLKIANLMATNFRLSQGRQLKIANLMATNFRLSQD
jgi:hypothetical protein